MKITTLEDIRKTLNPLRIKGFLWSKWRDSYRKLNRRRARWRVARLVSLDSLASLADMPHSPPG